MHYQNQSIVRSLVLSLTTIDYTYYCTLRYWVRNYYAIDDIIAIDKWMCSCNNAHQIHDTNSNVGVAIHVFHVLSEKPDFGAKVYNWATFELWNVAHVTPGIFQDHMQKIAAEHPAVFEFIVAENDYDYVLMKTFDKNCKNYRL